MWTVKQYLSKLLASTLRASAATSSKEIRTYHFNYISELVRALWLVSLADRTLLQGPLKCKVFLLPNCCVIYHQIFSTYEANNSLKLSFTLNCVLKRANDLKTISSWLLLLSTCFRNLKPLLMDRNRSRTRQTHTIYGPRASRLSHKSKRKNSVRNLRYGPQTRLVRGSFC